MGWEASIKPGRCRSRADPKTERRSRHRGAFAAEPDWDIVPGGEGAAPFERRVKAALVDLFSVHPGADVVVVTHGGVIQAALAGVVGRRTRGVFPFVIHNASLTVLQRFDSRTVVRAVNDTCHLA